MSSAELSQACLRSSQPSPLSHTHVGLGCARRVASRLETAIRQPARAARARTAAAVSGLCGGSAAARRVVQGWGLRARATQRYSPRDMHSSRRRSARSLGDARAEGRAGASEGQNVRRFTIRVFSTVYSSFAGILFILRHNFTPPNFHTSTFHTPRHTLHGATRAPKSPHGVRECAKRAETARSSIRVARCSPPRWSRSWAASSPRCRRPAG